MSTIGLIHFGGEAGVSGGTCVYNDYWQEFLEPVAWHGRVPWFGTAAVSPDSVSIRFNTQAQMDATLDMCYRNGIDYLAHVWFPNAANYIGGAADWTRGTIMPLKLHKTSANRTLCKFSIILLGNQMRLNRAFPAEGSFNTADWTTFQTELLTCFQDPGYMKVATNRPLVYFMEIDAIATGYTLSTLNTKLNELRTACTNAGLGTPYIVSINNNTIASAKTGADDIAADAVSLYGIIDSGGVGERPYSALTTAYAATWDSLDAGYVCVPNFGAGIDFRPIIQAYDEARYPYDTGYPGNVATNWTALHTSSALATHMQACIDWLASHPQAPDTILGYAYNEHAEGGRIEPRTEDGGQNLQALGLQRRLQRESRSALKGRGLRMGSR